MAARQRKTTESFKSYRAALKREERATQVKLRGTWAFRTATINPKPLERNNA